MTQEEKAKKYDEALEQATKELNTCASLNCDAANQIFRLFPQLSESEDERIRAVIVKLVLGMRDEIFTTADKLATKPKVLAWLKKLKEPVVDKEGMYYYLGGKFIYCGYPATEENPYEKPSKSEPKTLDWVHGGWDDEYMINTVIGRYSLHAEVAKKRDDTHDYNLSKSMENWLRNVVRPLILEKQKEPHYTKRNALFDKCVENCDPKTVEEVNKRVDDIMNMSELSAFEQALTNFIGYWEDDEEHWPSQFVKKHGKHILDMAREELKKEQKPELYYDKELDNAAREFYLSGGANSPVDSTGLVPIVRMAEFGATWMKERMEKEQKPYEPHNWPNDKDNLTQEQKPVELTGELSTNDSSNSSGLFARNLTPEQMREETLKPVEISPNQFDGITYGMQGHSTEQNPVGSIRYYDSMDELIADALIDEIENSDLPGAAKHNRVTWINKHRTQSAEWSEEDEDMFVSVLHFLNTNRINERGKVITWFKSLPKRFNLQPNNEWSEEDKRMLSRCIKSVECSKQFADSETYKAAKDAEINWLKNLSLNLKKKNDDVAKLCSNEWSEDEKQLLESIIDDYEKASKSFCGYDGKIGLLRAIRDGEYNLPKPEWSEDYQEENIRTRFAFYTCKNEEDDGVLYLSNVFVEEASRNHGFGTKILAAAEKVAETIGAIAIRLKVKQNSPANAWYRKNGYGYMCYEGEYDWLEKTLEYMKPNKQEWSEEDEATYNAFICEVVNEKMNPTIEQVKWLRSIRDRLKSLRPSWKPSEEQMKALWNAYKGGKEQEPLRELIEQLKKLM